MRVMATGGAGFIGSALVYDLVRDAVTIPIPMQKCIEMYYATIIPCDPPHTPDARPDTG